MLASLAEDLGASPDAISDHGDCVFPLFCCDELSNAELLPMFFTKASSRRSRGSSSRSRSRSSRSSRGRGVVGVVVGVVGVVE